MNVIRRAVVTTAVAALCSMIVPAAGAQEQEPVEQVPDNVLQSNDAGAITRSLQGFFNTQIPRLSGDSNAVSKAKEALVQPVAGTSSTTFSDAYSRELARAVAPLYGNNGTRLSARLAGAVAVEQVASRTPGTRLVDVVESILEDDAAAVSIWGIKAARPLASFSTRVAAGEDPLISGIVNAAKKHDEEGFVAHEAMMVLQDVGGGGFMGGAENVVVVDRWKPAVVEAVLEIIEHRLELYGPPAEGEVAPTYPSVPLADRPGTLLLANRDVWERLDQNLKVRVRTTLARLARSAGNAAAIAQNARRDTDDEDLERELADQRDELRGVLTSAAQSLIEIAGFESRPALATAARNVAELPKSASSDQIRERVTAMIAAAEVELPDDASADAAE
ncbi:MAG: hypothetical protein AAGI46_08245 [Planctomycetota bacterium]